MWLPVVGYWFCQRAIGFGFETDGVSVNGSSGFAIGESLLCPKNRSPISINSFV